MISRGNRGQTLNEVKLVENINKNSQNFLKISLVQKEFPPLHELQEHANEEQNLTN